MNESKDFSTSAGSYQNSRILQIGIVALMACLVYLNTLGNGFVYDDKINILSNKWITSFEFIPKIFSSNVVGYSTALTSSYYRPLMNVAFLLTHSIFGLAPWAYHLVNVLVHAGVSVAAYLVGSEIFDDPAAAAGKSWLAPSFLGALLFACTPLHTEVVAWVAALPDLSYSLCFLLSLYFYIKATADVDHIQTGKFGLSLLFFFLATLWKEPAITLMPALFLYDFSKNRVQVDRLPKLAARYLPFIVTCAIYFVLRLYALGSMAPSTRARLDGFGYLINTFPVIGAYLQKLVFPAFLSTFPTFHPVRSLTDPSCLLSIAATALFFILLVLAWKKSRRMFLALVITLTPLLPALYLPALSDSVYAERYLYLPSFGACCAVGIVLSSLSLRFGSAKILCATVMAVLVVFFSLSTFSRNQVWKSEYSLWTDVLRTSPDNARAHRELGNAFYDDGDIRQSIGHYQTSLQLNPDSAPVNYRLGLIYHTKGRYDEALPLYLKALSLDPGLNEIHLSVADIYEKTGKIEAAVSECKILLENDPNSHKGHVKLGVILANAKQYHAAVGEFDAALRLEPASVEYRSLKEKAERLDAGAVVPAGQGK